MGSGSDVRKSSPIIIKDEEEEPVVEQDKLDYNSQEIGSKDETFTVASTKSAKLIVEIPGGRTLTFNEAGAEVKVSRQEAEYLLSLKRGRPCCGGQQGSPLFILVGGKLWV